MADIVISEFMDEAAVVSLRDDYDVHYDPGLVDNVDALAAALAGARGWIVRNRTQVRGPLLQAAAAVEVIGRLGVGLDNIDLAACEQRGIVVCPATGANDTAVAEHVISAALLLRRPALRDTTSVAAGSWPRQAAIGREISGAVLGLVGYGAIARETARRAQALGMTVRAFDPLLDADAPLDGVLRDARLDDLLAAADVVSLHVPLTPQTRNLLDAEAMSRMRPDAVLVNTARGHVVDEEALVEALRAGRLGGAAIDVFAEEPVSTAGGARFDGVPNLLLTPHIAGVTEESNVRVSRVTADNVRRVLTRQTS